MIAHVRNDPPVTRLYAAWLRFRGFLPPPEPGCVVTNWGRRMGRPFRIFPR